jgi:hypothetical protein
MVLDKMSFACLDVGTTTSQNFAKSADFVMQQVTVDPTVSGVINQPRLYRFRLQDLHKTLLHHHVEILR